MNLLLLSATLLALLAGPVLYAAARRRPVLLSLLDGFVVVAISGLVVLEVLPNTLASGGVWALGFLVVGALGPTLLERQLHHARQAHEGALALAIVGLVMHSVGDGTALAPQPDGAARTALAMAIAIHSTPVGLAVWWLLYPVFGYRVPTLSIAAMAGGTVVGYLFSAELGHWLGALGWAWLQALVAGSILHVIFGRPHLDHGSNLRRPQPPYEGLGNLAGLAAIVLLESLHPEAEAANEHAAHAELLHHLLGLASASAPPLLAALAIVVVLGATNPSSPWLRLVCGGDAEGAYRRERLNGPLSAALRRLTLGPAFALTAVLLTAWLLGPLWLAVRAASTVLLGALAAQVLARLFPTASELRFEPARQLGGSLAPMPASRATLNPAPIADVSATDRLWPLDRLIPWLVCGLLLAVIGAPYLQLDFWQSLSIEAQIGLTLGVGAVLGADAVGATLIAATLAAAQSPSAVVLAFLLASAARLPLRLPLLRRLHGRRFAALYAGLMLLGAGLASVTVGALTDGPLQAVSVPASVSIPSALGLLCLLVLVLLSVWTLLRRGGRELFASLFSPTAS
jgi:hypothetical protein